jgi:hypothetical protein
VSESFYLSLVTANDFRIIGFPNFSIVLDPAQNMAFWNMNLNPVVKSVVNFCDNKSPLFYCKMNEINPVYANSGSHFLDFILSLLFLVRPSPQNGLINLTMPCKMLQVFVKVLRLPNLYRVFV